MNSILLRLFSIPKKEDLIKRTLKTKLLLIEILFWSFEFNNEISNTNINYMPKELYIPPITNFMC